MPLHLLIIYNLNHLSHIKIEDLLKNKADPNAATKKGSTPLSLAIENYRTNFVEPLINYRADVNQKHPHGETPLAKAIWTEKDEIIKQLCKAGASLVDINANNDTAFHNSLKFEIKNPINIIKTIMQYACFSNFEDKKITTTIKTALLVFNRLNIHQDLQFIILSKLLSKDYFHWKLYNQSLHKNYQPDPILLMNAHGEWLKKISQIKNKNNKTSLEVLLHNHNNNKAIKTLLDGSKLQKDLNIFNQNYPDVSLIPEDNLALQIYNNHYASQ